MRILDVGCGNNKTPGAIGLDINPRTQADVIADLDAPSYPFAANSFDLIVGNHVIEHVRDVVVFMEELHRLLWSGGQLRLVTPHYTNPRAYADPTHRRYLSLAADYFPLLLIIGIATTGILLRYLFHTDITAVKELALGLATFKPKVVPGISPLFYIHLFLVCVLFAYFPFSKLMHAPGVFLSPTRNLACNSRAVRHVNPWNYPVKFHSYEEYEDTYREAMIDVGLPVDKEA